MTGLKPSAWAYELATTVTAEGYGGWIPRLHYTKPEVPKDSMRNLTPLYAVLDGTVSLGTSQGSRVAMEELSDVADMLEIVASEIPDFAHSARMGTLRGIAKRLRAVSISRASQGSGASEDDVERRPAPKHGLPDHAECALRVSNSDFIEKRVAEGGYGPEPDSLLASDLHRFIYEYDDADPYRSSWFMHRLELVVQEVRAAVIAALSPPATPQAPEDVRVRADQCAAIAGWLRIKHPQVSGSDVMEALDRAHLLATPVTVTMEECYRLGWEFIKSNKSSAPMPVVVAEALRRVLPGRIQIVGSEGPK